MINYTGSFKVLQDIVNWINNFVPPASGGPTPPDYDPDLEDYTVGYYVGQYVTYDDTIYRCNTSISVSSGSPAGPFDDTKWDEVTDSFSEFYQLKPGKSNDVRNYNEKFNYPGNTVGGYCSHAEGQACQANGSACHAEGSGTNAGGSNYQSYCHAEGSGTIASGYCSHAEGSSTQAKSSYAHSEGYGTVAGDQNGYAYAPHAEGYYTEASGSYSHAEGYETKAVGNYSHSEGYYTQANESYSKSEGMNTRANGYCSKASGMYCQANGSNSEASGYNSFAEKSYSKADGYYCKAESQYEHAVGIYNKTYPDGNGINNYMDYRTYEVGDKCKIYNDPDGNIIYRCITAVETPESFDPTKWTVDGQYYNDNDTLIFEVGCGQYESNRSNAIEVFKDGRVKINGHDAIAIDPPATDGTYKLRCTVNSGVVTYSWVADV